MSQASVFGNHNTVVQLGGNGHTVVFNGLPYLGLTRHDLVPNKQPSERDLLIPDSRAIPLVGRDAELQSLSAFAGSGQGSDIKVRVLEGGGGSGKTRLALELCDRLKATWLAGFVTVTAFDRFFKQANASEWVWQQPTLLVFDYAAAHATRLADWLPELINRPQAPEHPLRILLLERQAETDQGWHQRVFGAGRWNSADARNLLDPPEPVKVRPITLLDDRLALLSSVVNRVNPALLKGDAFQDAVLAQQLRTTPWAGDPLYLAMAALTMARNGNTNALSLKRADLALEVAAHEQRLITAHAKDRGLDPTWIQHLCACTTLARGLSRSQAMDLLPSEAIATGLGAGNSPGLVVDLLQQDWPGDDRIAGIQPDLIGDAFVLTTWHLSASERWHAVLRLWPEHGDAVVSTLVRLVQDFGKDDKSARPTVWFKALLEQHRDDADAVQRIDRLVPGETVALAEINGWIAARLRALCGEDAAPELVARRAMGLAIAAHALGQHEQALAAAQEALALRRELAAQRPDAFTPDLAMSLNNLANRLSDLGQREPALESAQEAVALYRELAAQRPDAFTPDLASSLNNLASFLSALGQREQALAAAQEALALYRELAAQRPDAFTPDLARSLIVLALQYEQALQLDKACELASEAVAVLSPAFLALPAAHARLMMPLVRDWARLCQAAGQVPDSALLLPLLPALQSFLEA